MERVDTNSPNTGGRADGNRKQRGSRTLTAISVCAKTSLALLAGCESLPGKA